MSDGSLRSVLDAVAASRGATTVEAIACSTGIAPDLVRVALHQLVSLGLLGSSTSTLSCPSAGCAACASSTGACGTSPRGGLVELTLRAAPPDSVTR